MQDVLFETLEKVPIGQRGQEMFEGQKPSSQTLQFGIFCEFENVPGSHAIQVLFSSSIILIFLNAEEETPSVQETK